MTIEKITGVAVPSVETAIKKAVNTTTQDKTTGTVTNLLNKDILGESLVKRRVLGLFNLDKPLPFCDRTMQSFDEISPDKLLLVHLTDYFPQDGKIQTLFDMTKKPRNTLHFALNHAVTNPLGAGGEVGWTQKRYAILTPFKKALNQNTIGGKYNDFMLEGSFKLPEGSFIYKQNPEVKKGEILFSKLEKNPNITLIEANEAPYDMADLLVKKLGYTNLKEMHAQGMGCNTKTVNLLNDTNAMLEISKKIDSGELSWEEYYEMLGLDLEKSLERVDDNIDFDKNWQKIWNDFTKKINCDDIQHCSTSHSKLEDIFETLDLLDLKKAGWEEESLNYKKAILDALDMILENTDKKPKFVDVEKLKELIHNSKSPKQAIDEIESMFKIKNFFDLNEKYTQKELSEALEQKLTQLKIRSEEGFPTWNF